MKPRKEPEVIPYRFEVVGRNFEVTETMKKYAIDKISKIERFHPDILDVHVTLEIQKLIHTAVIVIRCNYLKIKVHASSNDMYTSIDRAALKLQRQIVRWKDRIQDHHAKGISAIDMQVNVLQAPYDEVEDFNDQIEEQRGPSGEMRPPKVISSTTRPLKNLTQNEAMMKLELSGDGFILYRDEASRKLKVLYRKKDGNYGLIQPE